MLSCGMLQVKYAHILIHVCTYTIKIASYKVCIQVYLFIYFYIFHIRQVVFFKLFCLFFFCFFFQFLINICNLSAINFVFCVFYTPLPKLKFTFAIKCIFITFKYINNINFPTKNRIGFCDTERILVKNCCEI